MAEKGQKTAQIIYILQVISEGGAKWPIMMIEVNLAKEHD